MNKISFLFLGLGLLLISACKKDCEFPIRYSLNIKPPAVVQTYVIRSNGAFEHLVSGFANIQLDSMIARSSQTLLSDIRFTSDRSFDATNRDGSLQKDVSYFIKNDSLLFRGDSSEYLGIVRPECGGIKLQFWAVSYTNREVPRNVVNQYFATRFVSESDLENIRYIIRNERLQENDTLFIGVGFLENK